MKLSYPLRGKRVGPATNRSVAKDFSAVIIEISTGQAAQASNRTKEAVKKWRRAEAAPDLASIINMARTLKPIRSWLLAAIDGDPQAEPAEFDSPRTVQIILTALQTLAQQPGPDGDAARSILGGHNAL